MRPDPSRRAGSLLASSRTARWPWLSRTRLNRRRRRCTVLPEGAIRSSPGLERLAACAPQRWPLGQGVQLGNRFYFEEVIAGKLLKKSVAFTRVEVGRHIEFTPTSWLMRLFLPRLAFRTEVMSSGRFRFIAEIFLRVGPLGVRLNRREFDAVREHMRIEGINFKRFAEQPMSWPGNAAA